MLAISNPLFINSRRMVTTSSKGNSSTHWFSRDLRYPYLTARARRSPFAAECRAESRAIMRARGHIGLCSPATFVIERHSL
jgi:hypothetical protein